MTAVTENTELARPMPGWNVAAELLPPEIIAGRRARSARKLVAIGLVALVLACVGTDLAVRFHGRTATTALLSQQARTAQLQAEQAKYNGITNLKGTIASVQQQIATLMGTDIDVAKIFEAVLEARPRGLTAQQLSISLTDPTTAAGSADSSAAALDTAGAKHIGTLTLACTVVKFTDVAAYLDSLSKLKGVVQPSPGAITTDKKGTHFSVTLTLTDALLSHQYDAKPTGIN